MESSSFYSFLIPNLKDVIGWQDIKIIENNEPMVDILKYNNPKIVFSKYYFNMGLFGAIDHCLIREAVASKLNQIAQRLPNGYKLFIFDCFRPIQCHRSLYESLKVRVAKDQGLKDDSDIIKYLSTFATPGFTNPLYPSPHFTGGAVDLTIVDNFGNALNMGTEFDDLTEKAYTEFYEIKLQKTKKLDYLENSILMNRRFLYNLMCEENFSNYKYEWWHYDFGNQFWAKINETTAQYSIIYFD